MDIKLLFGLLATITAIFCYLPYFIDIFHRRTKPHAYSWLVWTILQSIAVVAGLQEGAGAGIWGIAIGALFCFFVFLLSIPLGTRNITKGDTACLLSALAVLGFYLLQKDPLISVILITLIDFISFLPTMRKTWEEPETETPSTFALSGLAVIFGILALENYTVVTTLYMASLVITNFALVGIALLRRKVSRKNR